MNERALACHVMLLRLAGWLPDDTIAQCRTWLAEDRLVDLARSVAHAARLGRVQFSFGDLNLLGELYELDLVDPGELALLETAEFEPIAPVIFAPTERAARTRAVESCTEEGVPAGSVEHALVGWATGYPGLRAVWRCWRAPGDGAPYPPPVRVFVVETDRDADLPAIAARAQRELSSAGEAVPRVEVYPVGVQPPAYQTAARGAGALLWASRPNPGARVARVFDDVNAGVGSIRPDHPRIDSPERERLLRYLSAGEPLLATPALDDDVVAPELGHVVPISFRTDGYWVWSDAAGYYLRCHGLAPDSGLLAHIRAHDYVIPEIDGAMLQRAGSALWRFLREAGRASARHARSVAECHLYMRLHPCSCGEADFPWTSHEIGTAGGGDLSVYRGSCPQCGTARRFEFLVDSGGVAPPAFGGPEPSPDHRAGRVPQAKPTGRRGGA